MSKKKKIILIASLIVLIAAASVITVVVIKNKTQRYEVPIIVFAGEPTQTPYEQSNNAINRRYCYIKEMTASIML